MTVPKQWRVSFYLTSFMYSCHTKKFGQGSFVDTIKLQKIRSFFLLNYCTALDLDWKATYIFLCYKKCSKTGVIHKDHIQRSSYGLLHWQHFVEQAFSTLESCLLQLIYHISVYSFHKKTFLLLSISLVRALFSDI